MWSARCVETRTPGAAGGPGKRIGRKASTAPRSDPTGLSYRDVEELLAERGIEVDHTTLFRWVVRFTPLFVEAARPCRHTPGDRWFVDETYVKVRGRWRYLYRAVDQFGQVIDVLVSPKRDKTAARRFFTRALAGATAPAEVTTDRARRLPAGSRGHAARRPARHRALREQPGRGRPRPAQGPATTHARDEDGTDRCGSSPPGTRSSRTCAAVTTNSPPTPPPLIEWRSRSPSSPSRSDQPGRSAASGRPRSTNATVPIGKRRAVPDAERAASPAPAFCPSAPSTGDAASQPMAPLMGHPSAAPTYPACTDLHGRPVKVRGTRAGGGRGPGADPAAPAQRFSRRSPRSSRISATPTGAAG